jgi:hypothetical protein
MPQESMSFVSGRLSASDNLIDHHCELNVHKLRLIRSS